MGSSKMVSLNSSLDITVCILSHKRPHFLAEAIESVLSQTKIPKEFIVLDNGSGKEIEQVVSRYRDRGVIFEGTEITKTAVWNFDRALNRARTQYVLIMHDDDRLCPDFLERQVGYLDNHSNILAVFCNCHLINPSGDREGILKPYAMNKIFRSSAEVAMVYARGSCLPFPAAVYRAEQVRQIAIRKEFEKVADVVFMCDIADRGGIAYQKIPLYEYRIHDKQDSASISQELRSRLDEFLFAKIGESPRFSGKKRRYAARRYTQKRIRNVIDNYTTDKSLCNAISNIRDIDLKRLSFAEVLKYIVLLLLQKGGNTQSSYRR